MKKSNVWIDSLQKNRKAIAITLIVLSIAILLPWILSSSDEKTIVLSSVVLIVLVFWSLVHGFAGVIVSMKVLTYIMIYTVVMLLGVYLTLTIKMPSYLDGNGLLIGLCVIIQIILTQVFPIPTMVSDWVSKHMDHALIPSSPKRRIFRQKRQRPHDELFEQRSRSLFYDKSYAYEKSPYLLKKIRLWFSMTSMIVGLIMIIVFVYVTGIHDYYGETFTLSGIYVAFVLIFVGLALFFTGFIRSLITLVCFVILYGILIVGAPWIVNLSSQDPFLFWVVMIGLVILVVLWCVWFTRTVRKVSLRNHDLRLEDNLIIGYDSYVRHKVPISGYAALGIVTFNMASDPHSMSFVHLCDKIRKVAYAQRILFPGFIHDQSSHQLKLVFYAPSQKALTLIKEKLSRIIKSDLNMTLENDPKQTYYIDYLVPDLEMLIKMTNEETFKQMAMNKVDPDQIMKVRFTVTINDSASKKAFMETAEQMGYGSIVEYDEGEVYLDRSVILQPQHINDACVKLGRLVKLYDGYFLGWAVDVGDRHYWSFIDE